MKPPGDAVLDHLRVEPFVRDLVGARALATALELGLLDRVAELDQLPIDGLAARLGTAPAGLKLLLDLLDAGGVTRSSIDAITFTPEFREAWKYRDLIETKLDFAAAVLADFHEDFRQLLTDPGGFIRRSRTYELFRYDLCLAESPAALDRARRWMRITTGYTRYEAPVLIDCLDLSTHRRSLDVGGNSGELSLALCRANPTLDALVLDLPAVCRVGREHVDRYPEGRRIAFRTGSALTDALTDAQPGDRDLITFKSMLHDWPDREATTMLERAAAALPSGGRLVVFERGTFAFGGKLPGYALIPCVLFLHCYRESAWYVRALEQVGLVDVEAFELQLDSPFLIVTGRKA